MTRATDITERLRAHNDERLYQEADVLMSEAADSIDSLRAQVEALRDTAGSVYRALGVFEPDARKWPAIIEALRADAERYRWLRGRQEPSIGAADDDDHFVHGSISRIFVGTGLGHAVAHTGADLDSAIDAARSQEAAG